MDWCDHGVRRTCLPTRASLEGPHCHKGAALGVSGSLTATLSPPGLSALMRGCSVAPVSCSRSWELGLGAVGLVRELGVRFFSQVPSSGPR